MIEGRSHQAAAAVRHARTCQRPAQAEAHYRASVADALLKQHLAAAQVRCDVRACRGYLPRRVVERGYLNHHAPLRLREQCGVHQFLKGRRCGPACDCHQEQC
jgi:hypothetical protein